MEVQSVKRPNFWERGSQNLAGLAYLVVVPSVVVPSVVVPSVIAIHLFVQARNNVCFLPPASFPPASLAPVYFCRHTSTSAMPNWFCKSLISVLNRFASNG